MVSNVDMERSTNDKQTEVVLIVIHFITHRGSFNDMIRMELSAYIRYCF